MGNLETKIMTSGLNFTSSNLRDLGLSSYNLESVVDRYSVGTNGVFYLGSQKPKHLNPDNFLVLNNTGNYIIPSGLQVHLHNDCSSGKIIDPKIR